MNGYLRKYAAVWIALVLFLCIGSTLYAFVQAGNKRREACLDIETLKGLRRAEIKRQISRTEKILRVHHIDPEHPAGFVFGIPATLLVQGVKDQKDDLRRLKPADC